MCTGARRVNPAFCSRRRCRSARRRASARSRESCRHVASRRVRKAFRPHRSPYRAPARSGRTRARRFRQPRSTAAPTPSRRALECTSILAMSARWGWFSASAHNACAVPRMRPSESSATMSARSPRAMLAATPRQKSAAFARVMGRMKLTEAPPSTQSMSTSQSPPNSREVRVCSRRTVKALMTPAPRCSAPSGACGCGTSRARRAAWRGSRPWRVVRDLAHRHFDCALTHPDLLRTAGIARAGFIGHPRAGRESALRRCEWARGSSAGEMFRRT